MNETPLLNIPLFKEGLMAAQFSVIIIIINNNNNKTTLN